MGTAKLHFFNTHRTLIASKVHGHQVPEVDAHSLVVLASCTGARAAWEGGHHARREGHGLEAMCRPGSTVGGVRGGG